MSFLSVIFKKILQNTRRDYHDEKKIFSREADTL